MMALGLPFAVAGFVAVYLEARYRYAREVEAFIGYPLKPKSLWIPGLLAVSVILGNKLFPHLSILIVIALGALLITVATLFIRAGLRGGFRQLREHVETGLPRTVNELVLFLVAGVLASGIASILQTGILVSPLSDFDISSAIAILGGMIIFAAAGVHPVILISGFTPLILALDPDPNLLAITYLFAWSLGTSASPLSGTHLVFQGRYAIPSWKAAMWNWPYVCVMYLFSSAWLAVIVAYLLNG